MRRSIPAQHWQWLCFVCACLTGCSSPNHGALCDKALVDAHKSYENKDYQHAAELLKTASKEADLSDAYVHKHHVLREQVMVALAENDPVEAEKFARQLVDFEKGQEHAGTDGAWRVQWAEDMTRAEMWLGDSLRAQNRKREALDVYKEAVMQANQSVAPVVVSVTVSERYMQTLKDLGLRKGELITDQGAAANAFEDYNDANLDMYAYRKSKEWKKLVGAAEKAASGALECKVYQGAVAANGLAALAEFMLNHNSKVRLYCERALKVAHEHADKPKVKQNVSSIWLLLSLSEDNEAQARKDLLTAYATDWQQSESTRNEICQNLDQARWEQVFDRINEYRLATLHQRGPLLRYERWNAWVQDYIERNSLVKGVAWLETMSAQGEADGKDIADCYELILQRPDALAGINTKSWRRKILQIREELQRKEPDNQFNLAHLANAYHFVGQNAKALKLVREVKTGLDPSSPLNQYVKEVIARASSAPSKEKP